MDPTPPVIALRPLQDIFAVAVSLITGRIVYISDQAASILNCKRDVFKNAKFVEFLTPQDVSVFYSFTTPYRLPSWSMCTGAGIRTHARARKHSGGTIQLFVFSVLVRKGCAIFSIFSGFFYPKCIRCTI